ncbi:ASCH domain-containing protein [Candidatus Saccharibacteria bacterium]|nr:ASCH domain-containing protein [Candidatus Saccharibacteria bacterium]
MQMHFDPDIFELVKNGTKNVEARVNDAKRRSIKIGEKIEVLKRPDEKESIWVRVTKLTPYKNFEELAAQFRLSASIVRNIPRKNTWRYSQDSIRRKKSTRTARSQLNSR